MRIYKVLTSFFSKNTTPIRFSSNLDPREFAKHNKFSLNNFPTKSETALKSNPPDSGISKRSFWAEAMDWV